MNERGTVINLNGKIISIEDAKVSVFDRSFLYGDSLYEVVRTYQGKPFRLKEHLLRMEKSAALCQMTLSQTLGEYETEMTRSISEFRNQKNRGDDDVYVRIIVSRGVGRIGFGLSNLDTPTQYVIIVESLSYFPNKDFNTGARLQTSKRVRNHPKALDPAMKSGNYLNSLLAYLSAVKEGFDDALLLDHQGFMTEGSTYNLFYANRGIVATAPIDIGILDGITRRAILKLCIDSGIPCREVRFPKEYLYDADEVFISSSIKEVLPVLSLDGKKINKGKPGPITIHLKHAFDDLVKTELNLT